MASSSTQHPPRPPPYPPVVQTEGDPDSPSAVFVHTNLGTLFAFNVHFSDTVADLKKNMPKAHLTLFPEFKSIRIDAIKGYSYFLCDSMLVRTIHTGKKGVLFLFVDATICEEDQGLIIRAAEGSEVKVVNEEAAVKGKGTLVMEEAVHEETAIGVLPVPETALIGPAVIDNAVQVNIVEQNGHEHGGNNKEFIISEAMPKSVDCEPLVGALVCLPLVASVVCGMPAAVAVCEPVVANVVCEPVAVDVVGDKSSTRKRKKPAPNKDSSMKQDLEKKKHVSKQIRGSNSSMVPIPSDVPNYVKEGETHDIANMLRRKGGVAATNDDIVPIPVTVGNGSGLVLSASNREVENPAVRSGEEIMESSTRKEGRKETKRKRCLTLDRCSVAVQNYPKPSAKSGELSEPKAPQNNVTSSPAAFPSTSLVDDDAKKLPTQLSKKAAATKPRKQRVDAQPVKSHSDNGTNV